MIVYDNNNNNLKQLPCKIFKNRVELPDIRIIYFPVDEYLAGDTLLAIFDPRLISLTPLTRKQLHSIPAARRDSILGNITDQIGGYRNVLEQLKSCKSGNEIVSVLSSFQQSATSGRQVFQVNLTRAPDDDPITRDVIINGGIT
jgi:hypothetical protein